MAMHKDAGKFLELAHERYYDDPVLFAKEVIGIKLTEQQVEGLSLLVEGKHKLAIKSGHGTGKSCLQAIAILWFLTTRPLSRVVLTAPSARQLYDVLMAEVRQWYLNSILSEFELFRFTSDNIRINKESHEKIWFATCISVSNPENLSGMHAKDVFAVVDEGAGVDDEIFVRIQGILTTKGSYLLTCGNPSFCSGYFYDIFHKEGYKEEFDTLTFSCLNSPNVDLEWIESMKRQYGEDSNIFKVRVLGEFAPLDEETVIRRADLDKCVDRRQVDDEFIDNIDSVTIGVDVSSGEGNDYSVISIRSGYTEISREKVKMRLRQFRSYLSRVIEKYAQMEIEVLVNIDTTGLGFQLGQDLEDYFYEYINVEINKINFSHRAIRSKEYNSVFTEMIFTFADKLDQISLFNLPESTVVEDLGARRYGYDFLNRYQAEKKKEFVKRIGRSPDEGDAVLLAFYDTYGHGIVNEGYENKEEW